MSFFPLRTQLRLARSIITKDQPVYVQFYVTARCNLACEQCNIIYANADVTEIGLDGVARIADNLEKIGVSIVLLTGGEPFVRKDLAQIVGEFRRRGMHVRIQTNGLARPEALQACLEAGAHDISISLDSLHPGAQDQINGNVRDSWDRAIATIANVNRIFPEDAFAALGCVLAPRNLEHVPDVIRFATEIGWHVSLVPAHTTPMSRPMNFRSFDDTCRFDPALYPRVRHILDEVARMRRQGYLLYDSDEYLDDMYRLVTGAPVRWRDRNGGVCDSPNLYFAIQPNGDMAVCCDLRMRSRVSVAAPDFPERFFGDPLRREVHGIAAACAGCLYGSFPEMTISARFLGPMLRRFLFFARGKTRRLARLSKEQMLQLAADIRSRNPSLYGDA
jgi:MoaA/NifB/PqqE/SkfB family radical SAM enzyme